MMTGREPPAFWDAVRSAVVGRETEIQTPFGRRRLTYADHTASGRAVSFIEDYLRDLMALYGNTHTEDDATGVATSARLALAEEAIKRHLHAGGSYKLIADGAGTTAAVHRLQQILGVYIPPAARDLFEGLARDTLPEAQREALAAAAARARPVVFVGPYEHHSNEVSWRECFAEVVEVELSSAGLLDLEDLRRKVSDPRYAGRRKIGAFSAASNVSGVKTPVHAVARILHENGALAFFDYAAAAPYEPIDVEKDSLSYFDAVYFSPHKFLGGPGACGILLIHQGIYRTDLPPTIGAGGTVDFVNFDGQEYNPDIEVREKAGTPPIIQTLRAALAVQLKERLGVERITAREALLLSRAHAVLGREPGIEILGGAAPEDRLPILSFIIRVGSSYLHPRFVTTLLNDLFGIQSRAGCSCAAPYGHRLLHIDHKKSMDFRRSIQCGNIGLKPGWARVNLHFLHTDREADFILRAILFIARRGSRFLPLYEFDIHTGAWRHRGRSPARVGFGLDEALAGPDGRPAAGGGRAGHAPAGGRDEARMFAAYLSEAESLADRLEKTYAGHELKTTEADLIPFVYM
jgi:selenocysteine lyase/cysteine desulfurase